jgi:hypothetical protein
MIGTYLWDERNRPDAMDWSQIIQLIIDLIKDLL